VRALVDGAMAAGLHDVPWDGRDDAGRGVAPGIYFVRLTAGDVAQTRKVARLR
jgi:flagellar hook assembly protein FlgD